MTEKEILKNYQNFLIEMKKVEKQDIEEFVKVGDSFSKKYNLIVYAEELVKALVLFFTLSQNDVHKKNLIHILKEKEISPYLFFKYQVHLFFTFPYISGNASQRRYIISQFKHIVQTKENVLKQINSIKKENTEYFSESIKNILKKAFTPLGKVLLSFGSFISFLFRIFNTMVDFITAPIIKKLPGGAKTLQFITKGVTPIIPVFFSMNLAPTTLILFSVYNFSRGMGKFIGNIGETVDTVRNVIKEIENAVDEIDWSDLDLEDENI